MIDVTLIGTGALQPLPGRALAAACITCAGHNLLIDCGEGTQSAAKAAGISLVKIDIIAFTHYHGDHTFGLPGLLQSMGMAGRCDPVILLGPAGLANAVRPFFMLCQALPFDVILTELPPDGISLHELSPNWPQAARLFFFPTQHRVPSCGYLFELSRAGKFNAERARSLGLPVHLWGPLQHGETVVYEGNTYLPRDVLGEPRRGIRVAYTGDTAAFDELSDAIRDVDLLICEATYPEDEQESTAIERGHMTFSHAAKVAADAHVRRLWLTHFSPMIADAPACAPMAQHFFPEVCVGYDGLTQNFPFEEQ